MAHNRSCLGTLLALVVVCCGSRNDILQERFQSVLQTVVDEYKTLFGVDIVLQLGWKTAEVDLGLSAGSFVVPGKEQIVYNATANDTFLYGSGTKPLTAAAVLRLIDSGELREYDRISSILDPFLKRTNGTTLANLFGPNINNATVLDVIRMSAGIPDFEILENGTYPFDNQLLVQGDRVWTPYDYIHYAASTPKSEAPVGHLYCDPGNCSAYSSTSYQIAGLLLAAVLHPEGDWMDLDMRAATSSNAERYSSFSFMDGRGKLSDVLTVPGLSVSDFWEDTTIWDQNPSVLGWTCGNLVASAQDLARFIYDLLDESPTHPHIVSAAGRQEMMRLQAFSSGWGADNHILYGAGLMAMTLDRNRTTGYKTRFSPFDAGYSVGHGGETFGFNSFVGYNTRLGAAYTIVVNNDLDSNAADKALCLIMQAAADLTLEEGIDFGCKPPKKPHVSLAAAPRSIQTGTRIMV